MLLTSPSFENNAEIPRKFSCDGGDINPELQIQNVPDGTKSLALVMHDPDAPLPGGFTHWVMWNIDPAVPYIKDESVPPGAVEGMNGAGKVGYLGPCPPPGHGVHHYQFRLYALDSLLELPATAKVTDLEAEIEKHLIETAELVGLYERK
jgi:Raf kinase inhibitor-like YbhB/YbcL family protein